MENKTIYTAVGHLRKKHDGPGRTYPVIVMNQREYMMDMQEMAVWTALCWQVLDLAKLRNRYATLSTSIPDTKRTLESSLLRLQSRGLVASGCGTTDFDALYDLLGGLYVVPILERFPLRVAAFCNLVLFKGVSYRQAATLFRKDLRSNEESQVMALTRQAFLSTAELIKCMEMGVTDISTGDKIMAALYNDKHTTCDNIRFTMQGSRYQKPITMAVANLYLRKQIILQRL